MMENTPCRGEWRMTLKGGRRRGRVWVRRTTLDTEQVVRRLRFGVIEVQVKSRVWKGRV